MIERRQHERTSRSIRVEMRHPAFGTLIGFTMDISDGGAQVKVDNQPLPPVGTEVAVLFRKVVGPINSEPVTMRVVRQFRNTLGLVFVA
ncbi:PilZ domain-containing protein [uncultured Gilvimarinus sp.]|uniref:PilZ domain-containing protein n=1 Tax=uncultured Gilvimarinus sp. TaxID=1689143 RepID=UPI0030EEC2F7